MVSAPKSPEVLKLLKQQAALAAFGTFAFQETDLDKIHNEAARICADSLSVRFCKICRYRPEENDLLIVAGCGWKADVVGIVVSQADASSPQGRAFSTGEPVIIRNLQGANDLTLPPFYAEHGIVSTVDVVIPGFKSRPYGVLEVDSTEGHQYDEYDIIFLTGFANVLAEAVATATNTKALREALAQKDFLADEMHHRIRNHFTVILSMLRAFDTRGADGPSNMGIVARQVGVFAKVYDQLLGRGLGTSVDLTDYMRALSASVARDDRDGGRVTIEHRMVPVTVETDTAVALGMVALELITNAYTHAFPDRAGRIILTLATDKPGRQVTLTIADDGVGFVEGTPSLRNGLRLCRGLVAQIDGTAEIVTAPGKGTSWTVSFHNHHPTLN